ncbi:hypothetical protein [Candidatus Hodgkinia cicadicola]|uniref:hypothetical protein n=1 Tax=Candidatus Hodgkinia cicadicola TaxID=573658 RepID=UPI001788B422
MVVPNGLFTSFLRKITTSSSLIIKMKPPRIPDFISIGLRKRLILFVQTWG